MQLAPALDLAASSTIYCTYYTKSLPSYLTQQTSLPLLEVRYTDRLSNQNKLVSE